MPDPIPLTEEVQRSIVLHGRLPRPSRRRLYRRVAAAAAVGAVAWGLLAVVWPLFVIPAGIWATTAIAWWYLAETAR